MATAEIKNTLVPVAIESLDENTSGTYLLGDTKVVYLNFFRQNGVGMVSVKELYDLYSDPKGKVPKALRPFDVARLYFYLKSNFMDEGADDYYAEHVFNSGKYGSHKAMAVIHNLHVPGGTIKIEEKRFRLDKALNGEYICPAWLLKCMFYTLTEEYGEEEMECVMSEGYLKKIEVTPIPERRPRGERPPRRRVPRAPRQPNPDFFAEHGETIKEAEIEMAD